MESVIIADSSCLIVLHKIGYLQLLQKCYVEVIVTQEIAAEFGQSLPDWIIIRPTPQNLLKLVIEMGIDLGEASALALALELNECTVVLDDLKARKVAEGLGIQITGTFGVVASAKQRGIISFAKPIFDLILETNFRTSKTLVQKILNKLGE
jgi:predicted nucleic acid-binding protein